MSMSCPSATGAFAASPATLALGIDTYQNLPLLLHANLVQLFCAVVFAHETTLPPLPSCIAQLLQEKACQLYW